jgi:hypothetical protein
MIPFSGDDKPLHEVDVLVKTTRYIRLGMVAVGLLLATSVLLQINEHERLGSISAFYYTPVRTIFVGALIAIGICLICLKGNTSVEDWLLNCAGFFAPFVALIPTPNLPKQSFPGLSDTLSASQIKNAMGCHFGGDLPSSPVLTRVRGVCDDRNAAIHNNVVAALIVLGVGLLLVGILSLLARHQKHVDAPSALDGAFYVAMCGLYIGYVVWYNAFHGAFIKAAHPTSALLFFVFVGIAVAYNAIKANHDKQRFEDRGQTVPIFTKIAPGVYWATFGAMALSLAFLFPIVDRDHHVFNLEAAEIALFMVFWVTQTAELWNRGLRTSQGPMVILTYDDGGKSAVAGLAVSPGPPAPTGTITFAATPAYATGAPKAVTQQLVNGQATMSIDGLTGTYLISAHYDGDTNWLPSNSNTLTETISALGG